MKVGLMTCYDLRFPELAMKLALDGAQLLVLPAAPGAWSAQRTALGNVAVGAGARHHMLCGGGRGVW